MIERPIYIENTPTMPRYFWHPSVVYFKDGFGGHKWWLAQTPFHPIVKLEPYQDRWELPCIHYSDDGIHWQCIKNNPIDDLNETEIDAHDFMSDPHLVFRDGVLECWYRITYQIDRQIKGNKIILLRKVSRDGINWSEREIMADLRLESERKEWVQVVSPAIVWKDGYYECYYVDGSHYVENRHVCVRKSKDGIHWEPLQQCSLIGYDEVPWHIDVQFIDGVYHMLCFGDPRGDIVHMSSSDGVTWNNTKVVLQRSKGRFSFYSNRIYRACLVCVEGVYHIYFSGANRLRSYIGLLKTSDWKSYSLIGAKWNSRFTRDTISLFIDKTARNIVKIYTKIFNRNE